MEQLRREEEAADEEAKRVKRESDRNRGKPDGDAPVSKPS